ncbi:MAG TPA: glycosyltransferase, partial [Acidimicrobiia bacterium]|nr:glycosyltransferase [Acidimicrobiia bacterium]
LAHWPEDSPPDHRVWEEIHMAVMAEQVADGDFDIIHSHLNVHPLGYAHLVPVPMVTTLHGAAWNRGVHPALRKYRDMPFVSLSEAERGLFPGLNYIATVFNGINTNDFTAGQGKGGYLLFAGRMAPEKQPHVAIEVAQLSGRPIKLAGMIEDQHRDYFTTKVAPMTGDPMVEYLGDLERQELAGVYGAASAVIMPLAWDEPFGLVVVESLASGTPVIGWNRGALPELITDGVTGAIVDDVSGAVSAVAIIDQLDRSACRRDAETRFSVPAMTEGYFAAYQQVVEGSQLIS